MFHARSRAERERPCLLLTEWVRQIQMQLRGELTDCTARNKADRAQNEVSGTTPRLLCV